MVKRKENPWQFKFSLALAILMLFLVFGYFTQSFLEIRKVKPVSVAIERISEASAESDISPKTAQPVEAENKETPDQ
jgi:outer membrane biosynthesis protein TonB